jgi:hypothetical protein
MPLLKRGPLRVTVSLDPLALDISRAGRRLVQGMTLWAADGRAHDSFVQLTEGVIPREETASTTPLELGVLRRRDRGRLELSGSGARLSVELHRERVVIDVRTEPAPFRLGAEWEARPDERFTGLGARHGEGVEQTGRRVWLGADRRYTGPDCPPEMLELGGIPQGDTRPHPG